MQRLEANLKSELVQNRGEFTQNAGEHRKELRETLEQFQRQMNESEKTNREESRSSLITFGENFSSGIKEFNKELKSQFESLNKSVSDISRENETRLKSVTDTLDKKLSELQEQNTRKLEEMRATVDEKLQKTLNERLAESFRQVSTNLEAVNRGLGEMKSLANGVGDLKKVLSNVKTRGILGEIQLGNILEQILAPGLFGKNISTKQGSREQVEFAIKLPGKDVHDEPVWLPVDSKFPRESYERLLSAYELGDIEQIRLTKKELESAIKKSAKDIRDKYIDPPHTTDFGILFLPTEGLYAEIVRESILLETLHRDLRVIVAGPSTLAALLNSLQMGFQTLTFEKRSHEIREILGAVKKEFGTFGDVLKNVQTRLHGASDDLDKLVGTRTRKIQLKLRNVEELPETQSRLLLDTPDHEEPDEALEE
ncbi:MAG: DNA recombination protein RmuC [Deltaproteobacteria bacterium]|nr:DNA recombination protein RmuC [Deltaproteobacteria bacterium]